MEKAGNKAGVDGKVYSVTKIAELVTAVRV